VVTSPFADKNRFEMTDEDSDAAEFTEYRSRRNKRRRFPSGSPHSSSGRQTVSINISSSNSAEQEPRFINKILVNNLISSAVNAVGDYLKVHRVSAAQPLLSTSLTRLFTV